MDYIDTRELESELEELHERALSDLGAVDLERMRALEELEVDLGGWGYGHEMIAEHAFEDYARELAEDIGAISSDASWPASYIDWEAAADALRMGYSTVEFDDTTYYVRRELSR